MKEFMYFIQCIVLDHSHSDLLKSLFVHPLISNMTNNTKKASFQLKLIEVWNRKLLFRRD